MLPTLTFDVFVSYAAADRAWVEGFLLDALETAGVRLHTEDAFALGVPRLVEFERAIQQSRRTLLVLSPAYLADSFGQFVDVLVNSYGMETATWPVIPLILQPAALPARLRQLVPLDATTPAAQQAALAKLCAALQLPVPGPAAQPECPYPGMVPFDEADSARFFGREQEVQDLLDRLRLYPFLAVIGASGSGKSSLVRAGLIPALRKSRLLGSGEWLVRMMRPGEQPLIALASILAADLPPTTGSSASPIAASLLSNGHDTRLLADPAQAVAALLATQPDARRLLLVIDQFEELFTVAAADVEAFQQALLRVSAVDGCAVVLTVRADFYADLMTSLLWPQIQAHRVEVTPLTDEGLRRAIVLPADRAGVAIEGALVERLVADAAGEPGVLPLIQETLVLLWEHLERRFLPMRAYEALVLTRSAYDGQNGPASGLQVAIARRADATLADLTEAQQDIARRIFLRLIQFGQGRADTRRQQPLDALRSAGDDLALFDSTLQHLAASRLITLSGAETNDQRPTTKGTAAIDNAARSSSVLGRSSSKVDISHEALIRGWPALQGWLNERREGEQTRRRLEDKAAEWVRLGSGDGGLLDEIELAEAERWLQSSDADEMGFDAALPELVVWSRAAIEQAAQAQEEARQRELAQAQALAEEQQRRAEEQQQRAEEQAAASQRLRRRAVFLTGALAVAGLAIVAAVVSAVSASQSAAKAQTQQAIAVTQGQRAQKSAAEAQTQQAVAETARTKADAQSRQARAGELAAQSISIVKQFPERSLLLAVEALSTTLRKKEPPVLAAEQVIRDGLSSTSGRPLDGAAISDDGRFLATNNADGTIVVRDLTSDDLVTSTLMLPGIGDSLFAPIFSPDGHLLAGQATNGSLWVWDRSTDDPARRLRLLPNTANHGGKIWFSPHGRWLVTAINRSTRLWDLTAADLAASQRDVPISTSPGSVFNYDDRLVVAPAGLFDLVAGSLAPLPDLSEATFSPNGRWLATGGRIGPGYQLILWDLTATGPLTNSHMLDEPLSYTDKVLFSPDSRWLIVGGSGSKTLAWNMAHIGQSAEPIDLGDVLGPMCFSSDGHTLAMGSLSGVVQLWNVSPDTISSRQPLRDHTDYITSIRFSADGNTLITGSYDQSVRVWDLTTGTTADSIELRGLESPIRDALIDARGRTVVAYSNDGSVRVWHLAMLRRTSVFSPALAPISMAPNLRSISADGRWFAAPGSEYDNEIVVLDLNAAAPNTTRRRLSEDFAPQIMMLSADGSALAFQSLQGVFHVWNLRADPPISRTIELNDTTFDGGFSADGQLLASHNTAMIALWNLRADPPISRTIALDGPQSINQLTISLDGRWLASIGSDAAQV